MVSPFPFVVEEALFLEEEEQSPARSEPIWADHSEPNNNTNTYVSERVTL